MTELFFGAQLVAVAVLLAVVFFKDEKTVPLK